MCVIGGEGKRGEECVHASVRAFPLPSIDSHFEKQKQQQQNSSLYLPLFELVKTLLPPFLLLVVSYALNELAGRAEVTELGDGGGRRRSGGGGFCVVFSCVNVCLLAKGRSVKQRTSTRAGGLHASGQFISCLLYTSDAADDC